MMWTERSIERTAIHEIPRSGVRASVRCGVRIVVVVADAERGVRDLVANGVDALALRDAPAAGVAPRPDAGHPARPRNVPRRDPSLFRCVRIPPFPRDVFLRLESHLAEFLPGRRFVVAGVEPHYEIELVGDAVALIGAPHGVELATRIVVGRVAVGEVARGKTSVLEI